MDYAAPEAFKAEYFDGQPADVWNIGIILFYMLFGFLPFSPNSGKSNQTSSSSNKSNSKKRNKTSSTKKNGRTNGKLSATNNGKTNNKRNAPKSPKNGAKKSPKSPRSPKAKPKSPRMRPKSPQMRPKSPQTRKTSRGSSNKFKGSTSSNQKTSKNKKSSSGNDKKKEKEKDKEKEKQKEKQEQSNLSTTSENKDMQGMEKKICRIGFKPSVKASNGAWFPSSMGISADLRQLISAMLKNDAVNARWPAKQCYHYLGNLINVKNVSKNNKNDAEMQLKLKEKLKCWLCDKKEQITNFDYKIGMCGKCVRQTRSINDFLSNLFSNIDTLNDSYWHPDIYEKESKYKLLNDWQKLNKLKHINIHRWHESETGHTLLTFAAYKNKFHCVKFLLRRKVSCASFFYVIFVCALWFFCFFVFEFLCCLVVTRH